MYEERPATSRVPVSAYMGRRRDFSVNQSQERDGLGCVVAVYRMALDEQAAPGTEVISQAEARRILGRNDSVVASGGMANMGQTEARSVGIVNPMAVGEFKNSLPDFDQAELVNKPLSSILPKALEKGYFIMTTGPMGSYSGQKGGIGHAVYIYGLKYEGNDNYKFLIKDPLGNTNEWDYKNAIRDFWEFNYLIAPGRGLARSSRMQTGLTYGYDGPPTQEVPNNDQDALGTRKRFVVASPKKTFKVASKPPKEKIVFKRKRKFEGRIV